MATSISKAVPRSRLNIKYRTRIDGQVVPKELPLRLLIAGDFSGRTKELGSNAKPLPPLTQRTIYSIGKESTLEGVLGRARISLPIPRSLTTDREVALVGHATVRVVKTNVADVEQYLLSIKSSSIDSAVELVREDQPATPPATSVVARDTKLFQGEVLALGSFPISQPTAAPTMPKGDPNLKVEALDKWSLAQPAMELSRVWQTTTPVELCGNVAAAVSPAGEPPDLLEVVGKTHVYFQFEDDLSVLLMGDSRDAIEFRVRLLVPKASARRAVQLANMSSVLPGRVAMSVPQIRRLLVIRWLLNQGRSMIGSNPALRSQVKDMLKLEEARQTDGVTKVVATLPPAEVDTQKQYAQALLDKTKPPSPAPEPTYAAPLRALVEKGDDKSKEFQLLKGIVTSEWWAAWSVVKPKHEAETDEKKKQALAEQLDTLESPWDAMVVAVASLGLDKFAIKGAAK